jgi:hypothetical protein
MTTLKDIAGIAGVSTATASLALNDGIADKRAEAALGNAEVKTPPLAEEPLGGLTPEKSK